jgi:very-short-patch-repair endonuclease/DNA polymerase III delta prime subunit
MAATFSDRLRESKKNLLDLSLRNSLLNFRLGKRRGIQVVDESSKELFNILVRQKKTMSFKAAPVAIDVFGEEGKRKNKPLKDPLTDSWLQTPLSDDSLQSKLLATFIDASTYIEERGVNILFLALGMLKWYEDDTSDKELSAPLLLIPVTLERTSAREKFTLTYNDEELEGNLSLSEKLSQDFGLSYPEFPDVDDIDVPSYFAQIRRTIIGQTRWNLADDEIVLGFFSFGKFLMFKDLDENAWPKGAEPAAHPILGALLEDGFRSEEPLFPSEESLDHHWTPASDFQVVDADSSQLLAILEVRGGRNLVLQGPPGTGKSQTITNLIADAVGQRKKVLFVSEKMAALEVVKRRLDQIGLGCACLELHSHKANKKDVLEDLRKTLALGKPNLDVDQQVYDSYTKLRDKLNAYSEALHTPVRNTGLTPYSVIGEMIELDRQLKDISIPSIGSLKLENLVSGTWSKSDLRNWISVLGPLQSHLEKMGVPVNHAFYGSRLTTLLPADKQSILQVLETCASSCATLIVAMRQLAEFTGIRLPENEQSLDVLLRVLGRTLDAPNLLGINVSSRKWVTDHNRIDDIIATGTEHSTIVAKFTSRVNPSSWGSDAAKARSALQKYADKWWRIAVREYRVARDEIRKLCTNPTQESASSLADIADAIVKVSDLRRKLSSYQSLAADLFGTQWIADQSNWELLLNISNWVTLLHRDIDCQGLNPGILGFLEKHPQRALIDNLSSNVRVSCASHEQARQELFARINLAEKQKHRFVGLDLNEQLAALRVMLNHLDKLPEQIDLTNYQREISDYGIAWILDISDSWEGAGENLVAFFKYAWFDAFIRLIYTERPILHGFIGEKRSQAIQEFRRLDQRLLDLNRLRLASLHWEQLPKYSNDGQRGILLREFEKQRRLLPIRQLIERAGKAIQSIKPVFMMSPMSIASFLPHSGIDFDVVIFDEASQVKPVDAFGALLRAKQAVVVGDSKQLPPTSFFDSLAGDSDTDFDEDEVTDLTSDIESILGLMKSRGVLERSLRWHYRSRHESLIRVSNKEFYDDQLVIFPSAFQSHPEFGVRFNYFPHATYDRGRSRTNRIEAEAVAKRVMEHAVSRPHVSLGVVAFNISQMQAIIDQLELLRRDNGTAEAFFGMSSKEPFFVKNLESVQGDERDVIFISVGYGKGSDGSQASMNFGALNGNGGERRLNVLISRARQRCEVFSSLSWGEIDLSRTQSRGVSALKTYLRFAESGILDNPRPSGREPDSLFEVNVASALRDCGYKVDPQVGSAGYFIDIAVEHPQQAGQYVLAIECDGASYHSARTARDRDRLRQQVLEQLGWKFHRVWSTDWFSDPEREMRKLKSSIDRSLEVSGTPVKTPAIVDTGIDRAVGAALIDEAAPSLSYPVANIEKINPYGLPIPELSMRVLVSAIITTVTVEGPIHCENVYSRVASAAGVGRIGSRIMETFKLAVREAVSSCKIVRRGEFLWSAGMTIPPVRDRSNLASTERNIDLIAPEEIVQAIKKVISNSCGIDADAVAQAVCRRLGFSHVTDGMRGRVNKVVSSLKQSNSVIERGGQLFLSS